MFFAPQGYRSQTQMEGGGLNSSSRKTSLLATSTSPVQLGVTPTIAAGSPLLASQQGVTVMTTSSGAFGVTNQSSLYLTPDANATMLRVLSFNIWGIFNAKYRKQRLMHFGAQKVKDYDIICLQEQFDEDDFRIITTSIPEPLRSQLYFKRFPSSFIGSGLAVISRFEIVHSQFLCYPTQGFPEKVYHGDFFANKGVALVRILVPQAQRDQPPVEISVYTTHLVAQYEKYSVLGSYEKETYAAVRMSQAHSLANFICGTSRASDNVVLCGDFNASPSSPEMKLILAACHFRGSFDFIRTIIDDDHTNFTYTFDNQFNTDSTGYLKIMNMQEDIPIQLDHIMFHGRNMFLVPSELPPGDVAPQFQVHNRESASGVIVFTNNKEVSTNSEKNPTCPLSDHYGVSARFCIGSTAPVVPGTPYTGSSATSAPTQGNQRLRSLVNSFSTTPHLPQLLVDTTSHRKSVEYAASFLSRSAAGLRAQSSKLTKMACVLLVLPLTLLCLNALVNSSSSSLSSERTFLASAILTLKNIFCFPLTTFAIGASSIILVILAKIHRINDAVVMTNQSEDARSLLSHG